MSPRPALTAPSMVERLRAGDVERAARVTRAHRERARRELVTIFERLNLAQM
jgi:DNA-binding GntR family transcriptional regulator